MSRPNRSVINAIELGAILLAWYAADFSSKPNYEETRYLSRLLLDNTGLSHFFIPHDREARLHFHAEVVKHFERAGRKELAAGVRLGWMLGLFDKTMQENHQETLSQIMQVAEPLGITKPDILALVEERTSRHQPGQAEILLKHIKRWADETDLNTRRYAFLCHASEDKECVRKISDWLNGEGLATWLDKNDIGGGEDWNSEIKKALKEATMIVIFLSSNSVKKRGYVQREINIAFDISQEIPEGQIFLVPVMLEPCEIPSRLKSRQGIMLFEPNGFDLLKKALQTQLGA